MGSLKKVASGIGIAENSKTVLFNGTLPITDYFDDPRGALRTIKDFLLFLEQSVNLDDEQEVFIMNTLLEDFQRGEKTMYEKRQRSKVASHLFILKTHIEEFTDELNALIHNHRSEDKNSDQKPESSRIITEVKENVADIVPETPIDEPTLKDIASLEQKGFGTPDDDAELLAFLAAELANE